MSASATLVERSHLTCEVMNFNVNQNLEEVISADVTLKPTQSSTGSGYECGTRFGWSLIIIAKIVGLDGFITHQGGIMQKFVDRAGRIWIVDIDNTTLRRVKTLTGVHLTRSYRR